MIVFLSLVFPDEAVEILLFINLCVIFSLWLLTVLKSEAKISLSLYTEWL